jgi:hypothetical protein
MRQPQRWASPPALRLSLAARRGLVPFRKAEMGNRIGRPEKPITWHGPLAKLGHALRDIRRKAGMPPYRVMGERAYLSPTTLAKAADGRTRPTWGVTEAYARACDASDRAVSELRLLWEKTDPDYPQGRNGSPYADPRPSPPGPGSGPRAFIRQLRALRTWAGNPSPQEISRRSGQRLPASTMYDALSSEQTRLPSLDVTLAIVKACAPDDVPVWSRAWQWISMDTRRFRARRVWRPSVDTSTVDF